MKITLFLLVCCTVSAFSSSYSQTATLNLKVNSVTVEEVLNQIEEQSEFRFLYNKKLVDVDRKVNLTVKRGNISETLKKLFEGNDVDYVIFDRQIVLSHKEDSKSLRIPEPMAQQQANQVRGVIMDSSGEPLPGVSIVIKGTTTGTIADLDGKFTINAPVGSTLRISYIGYLPQEIKVEGNGELSILMQEDAQELEGVVVVGFGHQKKESVTGAITAISGKELMATNTSTTSTALAGKVVGINSRMTDGRPGAGTMIRIRGMGNPLYVIDGVQKDEGQFNNIDPNDIASISILKDASAAIYGVRAANGVIVVTTKSGARNTKTSVNVNAYYGWQDMFRFPQPADTKTYVDAKYQSDVIRKAKDSGFNMKYTPEEYAKWQAGTEKGYQGFDWYDYILNTAPMSYVGGNMSGGSENMNYYLALSHLNQDAIIRNYGGFYRTNMQMNLDADLTKKFKIGGSMNGRIEKRKHPGVPGGDDTWQALFAIYRNLPTVRPFANDNPDYPAKTSSGGETNFGMLTYDKAGEFEETWRVIQLNISAEYKVTDFLNLKAQGGYYLADRTLFNHEYTYKLYDYDAAKDEYKEAFSMDNPWMEKGYEKVEETTMQATANLNKSFNSHTIAATLGAEAIRRKNPNLWLHDRPSANAIDMMYPWTIVEINDLLNRTESRVGFIGRVNYDYQSKYLLELIGRYDGSWKYPKGDRWGFFPSVSGGWRISEEPFWDGIKDEVSSLKLRASYGIVGSDDYRDFGNVYNAYDFLGGYSYNKGGAVLDGEWVAGSQNRGLPVKTLSWMEAKMFNVGFDVGLFNDRLTGEFSYFTRKMDGIPVRKYDVLIPNEAGFELPYENLNSNMIKGVEGALKWTDNISDFGYSIAGNFTFSRQYDWEQYKPRFGNSWNEYRNSQHHRYAFIWWGQEVIGQFQDWEQIANHPVNIDGKGNTTMRPGDFIYKDVNGDGVINDMDVRPIGYRTGETPYLNYNFVLTADYKGFDLNATFGGSSYASYYIEWEMRQPLHDGGNNPQFYLSNQWHLSDIHDANSPLIPGKYPTVIEGNGDHRNYWGNDFWLKNVSYLKLRNLEFGYTVPKNIVKKMGMQKIRLYTSMQNLFSIDNLGDVKVDPELSSGSGVQYPTNRVISLGCNLTF
jgi:TonB-linked outer membrane protein, SusC/RagA family